MSTVRVPNKSYYLIFDESYNRKGLLRYNTSLKTCVSNSTPANPLLLSVFKRTHLTKIIITTSTHISTNTKSVPRSKAIRAVA